MVSHTPVRFILGERDPRTHRMGRWLGPRAGLPFLENIEVFLSLLAFGRSQEPWGSVKGGVFRDRLNGCERLKKDSTPLS